MMHIFQLVSEAATGEVYAMKKMRKAMVTSTQIREERDIMASRQSDWITSLQYAFQVSAVVFKFSFSFVCPFLCVVPFPVLSRIIHVVVQL